MSMNVRCPCGCRLRQCERSEGATYVVQFCLDDGHLITRCPQCDAPLYPLFKAGELERCA